MIFFSSCDSSCIAVQCWDEVDDHIDYVWKYPREVDENNKTVYGGIKNHVPVGGTSIYLDEEFRKILTGLIDVDSQGPIGTQEVEYAKSLGLNIIKIKATI